MKRRSFLLHIDSLDVLDELSNDQAGMLLKAMRDYHNDKETTLDSLTKIVFSPFKNQFNRDSLKYQTTCERRAKAGSIGGKQKVANASKSKHKLANVAENDNKNVNVNDNDNVSDNVNKSDSDNDSNNVSVSVSEKTISKAKALPADLNQNVFEVFDYWINTMQKPVNQTQLTPKRKKVITDRLKNGYSVDAIKAAIYNCSNDAFSMGDNDRCKPFNDIELICRTGEKLESFIERSTIKSKKDDPYNFAAIDAMTFDEF
jgi:hypothetical protein